MYLVTVEGPRAELHLAFLLVERKVSNVDRARALVDRRRYPQHVAVTSSSGDTLRGVAPGSPCLQ